MSNKNNTTGFKLKNFENIFKPTDEQNSQENVAVTKIGLDSLVPFRNHPFRLYEGQRFDDMVASVRENGIIMPIIVRPLEDGTYEILSGHNRTKAARAAGLEKIPAIVSENLSSEEAMLIVTETNLIQRSFADLSHSERALTLAIHHEALKNQGRRTDIVNEVENILKNGDKSSNNADNMTFRQVGEKCGADKKLAQSYDLSSRNVSRYLRINKLIEPLKRRLDNDEFGLIPAVEISYIPTEEQQKIDDFLAASQYRLDMKKAESLRSASAKKPLTSEDIALIFTGKKRSNTPKSAVIKLKQKALSKFFTAEQKPEEIQTEIIEALEFYRTYKDKI